MVIPKHDGLIFDIKNLLEKAEIYVENQISKINLYHNSETFSSPTKSGSSYQTVPPTNSTVIKIPHAYTDGYMEIHNEIHNDIPIKTS